MNLTKLKAMGMIANAMMPVLSLVAIALMMRSLIYDIGALMAGPAEKIGAGVAEFQRQAENAGEAIGSALARVNGIEAKIADAADKIRGINPVIEIPAVQLPAIDLRIEPSVRLASRDVRYAGFDLSSERVLFLARDHEAAFRPAVWRVEGQPAGWMRAGFLPKPPVRLPSPPTNIPSPPISIPKPSVQVEWRNRTVQLPRVPGFAAPVLGLEQTRALLARYADLLRDLRNLAAIFPLLDAFKGYGGLLMDEKQNFALLTAAILPKLLLLIGLAFALAVPILIKVYAASYFRWLYRQWTGGWRRLRGEQSNMLPIDYLSTQEVQE